MTDYNVAKLAKDLDLEAHIVRTKLRAASIEKTDGKYEWTKEKDYQAVLKQLKSGDKTPKAKAEVETKSAKGKVENKDAGKAPDDKSGKKAKKGKKAD